MRNAAYETDLPAIRDKIKAGQPVLPRDYLEAQAAPSKSLCLAH